MILTKRPLVLVIGQSSKTTESVLKYISRCLPASIRSKIAKEKPLFKFGEIVDMDSSNGSVLQVEKIPLLYNHDRGSWFLRRLGDERMNFVGFTHYDLNPNPNNNEALIFQKNDIIGQANSFIVIVDYDEHDMMEDFLESINQNYLSILSTSLATYEQLAPILVLIAIKVNNNRTLSQENKYVEGALLSVKNIFARIFQRDKNRKLYSNRYIFYQPFNSSINDQSNIKNEGINYGVNLLCRTLEKIYMP